MSIKRDDRLWFGSYGGCFIADAFTLACDRYYNEYKKALEDAAFLSQYECLKEKYADSTFSFQKDEGSNLTVCYANENIYPILGTALLSKYLGKKQALCGARYPDEAFLCARVCAELNVPLKLYLSSDLSGISSLTNAVLALGASIETKQCKELFNLPEMYAFQAWVASPDDHILINCRQNAGAYPQVNIATDFAKEYGEKLRDAFLKNGIEKPSKIVVPCVSGSFALSIFKAFEEDGTALITVECDAIPDLSEEQDSYCGTFTKVMRNNISDRVLSPELSNLIDGGRVTRRIVPYQSAADEMRKSAEKKALSLQSYAALSFCRKNPANGLVLCVLRGERWGAAL